MTGVQTCALPIYRPKSGHMDMVLFALLIDSNRKLLGNISNIAWNELPLNYLDTWQAQVEKVTAADIKAAMAAKLQPDKMVTIVLGAKP